MIRLKRLFWGFSNESKLFALWLLQETPLEFGVWLRRKLMKRFLGSMGDSTTLQTGIRLVNPERISIGSNCNFGQGVFITGGGGVRIGDWVGLGPDVKIWSVNHRFDDPDTPFLQQGWEDKPVVIENDVWLGANVFVMPGVTIRQGAIISAGTIVNKSIPAYALVAGNPSRVVGWRKRAQEEQTPNTNAEGR